MHACNSYYDIFYCYKSSQSFETSVFGVSRLGNAQSQEDQMWKPTPLPPVKKRERHKASNIPMKCQNKMESSCTNTRAHLNNCFKAKDASGNSGCRSSKHHRKAGVVHVSEGRLCVEWCWCNIRARFLASTFTVHALSSTYVCVRPGLERRIWPRRDGHFYLKKNGKAFYFISLYLCFS